MHRQMIVTWPTEILAHLHVLDPLVILATPLVLLWQAAVHSEYHVVTSCVHHRVAYRTRVAAPLCADKGITFTMHRGLRLVLWLNFDSRHIILSLSLLLSLCFCFSSNDTGLLSLFYPIKTVFVEYVINTAFVSSLGRCFLAVLTTDRVCAVDASLRFMATKLICKSLLFEHYFPLSLIYAFVQGLFKLLDVFFLRVDFLLRIFLSELHRWGIVHEIIYLNNMVAGEVLIVETG